MNLEHMSISLFCVAMETMVKYILEEIENVANVGAMNDVQISTDPTHKTAQHFRLEDGSSLYKALWFLQLRPVKEGTVDHLCGRLHDSLFSEDSTRRLHAPAYGQYCRKEAVHSLPRLSYDLSNGPHLSSDEKESNGKYSEYGKYQMLVPVRQMYCINKRIWGRLILIMDGGFWLLSGLLWFSKAYLIMLKSTSISLDGGCSFLEEDEVKPGESLRLPDARDKRMNWVAITSW